MKLDNMKMSHVAIILCIIVVVAFVLIQLSRSNEKQTPQIANATGPEHLQGFRTSEESENYLRERLSEQNKNAVLEEAQKKYPKVKLLNNPEQGGTILFKGDIFLLPRIDDRWDHMQKGYHYYVKYDYVDVAKVTEYSMREYKHNKLSFESLDIIEKLPHKPPITYTPPIVGSSIDERNYIGEKSNVFQIKLQDS